MFMSWGRSKDTGNIVERHGLLNRWPLICQIVLLYSGNITGIIDNGQECIKKKKKKRMLMKVIFHVAKNCCCHIAAVNHHVIILDDILLANAYCGSPCTILYPIITANMSNRNIQHCDLKKHRSMFPIPLLLPHTVLPAQMT